MTSYKNNVLVVGGSGGLGSGLTACLEPDYKVFSVGSKNLNVLDRGMLKDFFADNEIGTVVNLSGYNYDCLLHRYNESNFDEIDKQIDIVTKGTVNLLNACLPGMRERGYGRVILASSILASSPVAGTSVYAASKSFIEGLVKACSVENRVKGITANAIQIGYFDGGLTHRIPDQFKENILDSLPSKRWGTLEELSSVVRFLIDNEYISGTTIKANGGADF